VTFHKNLPFFNGTRRKRKLPYRAVQGWGKEYIARTLHGHFFELFDYTSAIKEIHLFLPDFCALRDSISRFHAKNLRKIGHTLYQKTCIEKGTRSYKEAQWKRKQI
jgi:hypothetical protein